MLKLNMWWTPRSRIYDNLCDWIYDNGCDPKFHETVIQFKYLGHTDAHIVVANRALEIVENVVVELLT